MQFEEHATILRTVLDEVCADEQEILGPVLIEQLIEGHREFLRIGDGDFMDQEILIKVVVDVIEFTTAVMGMVAAWMATRGARSGSEDFKKDHAEALAERAGRLTAVQQTIIINIVMNESERGKTG